MTAAKRFKKFREKLQISQAELASMIGITREQVSHIERGRYQPRRYSTMRRFVALEGKAGQSKSKGK